MADDTVLAPFQGYIVAHMAVCTICSAVVPEWSEAQRNHEQWHLKNGETPGQWTGGYAEHDGPVEKCALCGNLHDPSADCPVRPAHIDGSIAPGEEC